MVVKSKWWWSQFSLVFFITISAVTAITVERLIVEGEYNIPNCSVDVTCYVNTDEWISFQWVWYRGVNKQHDLTNYDGFTVGRLERTSPNNLRQTISVWKCYYSLSIMCRVCGSSKTVHLSKGNPTDLIIIYCFAGLIGFLAILFIARRVYLEKEVFSSMKVWVNSRYASNN